MQPQMLPLAMRLVSGPTDTAQGEDSGQGAGFWGGGRALEKGVSKGHEEVVSLSGKCFTEAALRPDMVALFWGNNPSM